MYKSHGRRLYCNVIRLARLLFVLNLYFYFNNASDLDTISPPQSSTSVPSESEDCLNEPYCSDIQGFKAISELHSQLDDDQDGQVDIAESDDFLREELQYENGQERHKIFHRQKKHLTVGDLWEAWKKSEVHDWTVQETTEWLASVVDLPQYSEAFIDNAVDGATLPRLASNSQFLSLTLGIKDPIHRRKISVKAMDVVLFGPPKNHNLVKDAILWGLLVTVIAGSWAGYLQHTRSQRQLLEMNKHLEGLQKAEDELKLLQAQLSQTKQPTDDTTPLKEDDESPNFRKSYKRNDSDSKVGGGPAAKFQHLQEELRNTKAQLLLARQQLEANRWIPPFALQLLLQLTYEIESKHFNNRKISAERELEAAKEGCDRLRKKKTSLLASFQLARDNAFYDIDGRILRAKSQLKELTDDWREKSERWTKIEKQCGFSIIQNAGLTSVRRKLQQDSMIYLPSSIHNGSLEMSEDDYENCDTHVGATTIFPGEAPTRPSPPRRSLYHHDSGNSLHSSSASTPSEKIPPSLSSPPISGNTSYSGVGHLDTSRSNSEDIIHSMEVLDIDDPDRVSLPPDVVATASKSSTVSKIDVTSHQSTATFVVGESTLDSSPETESIQEFTSSSVGYIVHQTKSGISSDQQESSKCVTGVAKSISEVSLNSSKSFQLATNFQSSPISLPTNSSPSNITSQISSGQEEQVSNDDSKDKKKKKRINIFRLKPKRA